MRATCLRRTKAQVEAHLPLPPRVDHIEWIDLSPSDRELYEYFKAKTAAAAAGMSRGVAKGPEDLTTQKGYRRRGDNIIRLINILRLICGNGEMLLPESALAAWRNRQNDSMDWQTMQKWFEKQCDMCGEDTVGDGPSSGSRNARHLCLHIVCSNCLTDGEEEGEERGAVTCPICKAVNTDPVKAKASRSVKHPGPEPQHRPVVSSNKILSLIRNICEEQRSRAADPGTKRLAHYG